MLQKLLSLLRPITYTITPIVTPATKQINTPQKIPRVIYQTMRSSRVPTDMNEAISSWTLLNPEYTHYFYTDEMCRQFIKRHFNVAVLHAYDHLVPGAFKADLWRYCVLYKNGGVYADVDMVAVAPLREILNATDTFVSVKDRGLSFSGSDFAIYNAFICCTPEHPILKSAINFVVQSVANNFYGINSLHPTGPIALGEAIKRSGATDYKLLVHSDKINYVVLNDKKCIYTKYDGYLSNLNDIGVKKRYHDLWATKNIYSKTPSSFYRV